MPNKAVDSQEQLIADARRLLKPGEVRLHKMPTWLNRRLVAYRKTQGLDRLPLSMLLGHTVPSICGPHSGGWVDHWGMSDGGPFACCGEAPNLVSEPYGFGTETAKALDRFCEALGGLKWHVSSNSWWFPGSTVRIIVHEVMPAVSPSV